MISKEERPAVSTAGFSGKRLYHLHHIGLYEGIGGFSLAARHMGWHTIAYSEINPFCRQVLAYHFSNAVAHGDINTTDFSLYRGRCGILTAGMPCQPFSVAGEQQGTADNRYLWQPTFRAVREIRPPWFILENVPGLVSWGGGVVFHTVQADLEAEGYEVAPFVLPAAGVGAPHRRDRIWIVAHAVGNRWQWHRGSEESDEQPHHTENGGNLFGKAEGYGGEQIATDPANSRLESVRRAGQNSVHGSEPIADTTKPHQQWHRLQQECQGQPFGGCGSGEEWFNQFPTQSPVCAGNDGLPPGLDGITFPKWRNESIKAAGNAIVPQVALQIFKAIQQYEAMY